MTRIIASGWQKRQRWPARIAVHASLVYWSAPRLHEPEQADSAVTMLTRRTMFYSRRLLYELLTSVLPFDTEAVKNTTLDEVRAITRKREPASQHKIKPAISFDLSRRIRATEPRHWSLWHATSIAYVKSD